MKRDMDLIRNMLLDVEAERMVKRFNDLVERIDEESGADIDNLRYHGRLIIDVGFALPFDDTYWQNVPIELTWAGCDFLDTIRDDAVWTKTKAGASKAAGAGFGFIVELAKGYAKAELTKLGLPIV